MAFALCGGLSVLELLFSISIVVGFLGGITLNSPNKVVCSIPSLIITRRFPPSKPDYPPIQSDKTLAPLFTAYYHIPTPIDHCAATMPVYTRAYGSGLDVYVYVYVYVYGSGSGSMDTHPPTHSLTHSLTYSLSKLTSTQTTTPYTPHTTHYTLHTTHHTQAHWHY